MVDGGGTDWAGYYAWSAGREPRPLLLAACRELGAGQDRTAIDLGCGEGTDALELLARGWSVPDMTFHARNQVEVLLDGLDILRLEETEYDGRAFSGPKHWHTFDILARKPASEHPPAPEPRLSSWPATPHRCLDVRHTADADGFAFPRRRLVKSRTRRFRGNVAHVAPEDRFPI